MKIVKQLSRPYKSLLLKSEDGQLGCLILADNLKTEFLEKSGFLVSLLLFQIISALNFVDEAINIGSFVLTSPLEIIINEINFQ